MMFRIGRQYSEIMKKCGQLSSRVQTLKKLNIRIDTAKNDQEKQEVNAWNTNFKYRLERMCNAYHLFDEHTKTTSGYIRSFIPFTFEFKCRTAFSRRFSETNPLLVKREYKIAEIEKDNLPSLIKQRRDSDPVDYKKHRGIFTFFSLPKKPDYATTDINLLINYDRFYGFTPHATRPAPSALTHT